MHLRKVQLKDLEQLAETADPTMQDFLRGPSPGGAATQLGISRQRVHQLIKEGKLAAVGVYDGRKLVCFNISRQSIAAFKERRRSLLLDQLKRAL